MFEAILNFRDFGGCRGTGGTLVRGRLYRSAALDQATEADLDSLDQLDIRVVVDLRRWSERQLAPSRRPARFAGTVIETVEQDVAEAPHDRYLAGDDLSATVLRQRVTEFYREAPFDVRHQVLFRQAFEALAAGGGPILIHCAAGKDRTGLLVALIQTMLGAAPDDVMAEYMLTAAESRLVDRLTDRAVAAAATQGKQLDRKAAEALTSVHPSYLETATDAIIDRHGSFEAYLGALGIDAGALAALRNACLA